MDNKVTKFSPKYPEGSEPDYIVPATYCAYRFIIGKDGKNPIVAICMNPSAAKEESSDSTINRIIGAGKKLGMDGWFVFNTYPERATDAKNMDEYNEELSAQNIAEICNFLKSRGIKEVWGAWGNDNGLEPLIKGRNQLLAALNDIGVKVFYFGTLTKQNNPRHPLQRQEKWIVSHDTKNYL